MKKHWSKGTFSMSSTILTRSWTMESLIRILNLLRKKNSQTRNLRLHKANRDNNLEKSLLIWPKKRREILTVKTTKTAREIHLSILNPSFHYLIRTAIAKASNRANQEYVSNKDGWFILESAVKPSFNRLNIRDYSLLNMLANQRSNSRPAKQINVYDVNEK